MRLCSPLNLLQCETKMLLLTAALHLVQIWYLELSASYEVAPQEVDRYLLETLRCESRQLPPPDITSFLVSLQIPT
jgi:hypothetical protein